MTTSHAADLHQRLASGLSAGEAVTVSCRAFEQVELHPVSSQGFVELQSELQAARDLALRWESEHAGALQNTVFRSVVDFGELFQESVVRLLARGEEDPEDFKHRFEVALGPLNEGVGRVETVIRSYENDVQLWGRSLRAVHDRLADTILEIQGEATHLKGDIAAVERQIAAIEKEVRGAKGEIAAAKDKKTGGTVATIFGVALAFVTGGLSLVIAGIGVSSIQEAEAEVRKLEEKLRRRQAEIGAKQRKMEDDQAQLIALGGLTLSARLLVSDVEEVEGFLDTLRTDWRLVQKELEGVAAKIRHAADSETVRKERVWLKAVAGEWAKVVSGTRALVGGLRAPRPRIVRF